MTNSIFRQLNCKRVEVDANLVGLDSRIKEINLLLHMESNDVRIVGIYGIGGIGKTTIAKVIYNELSREFECVSFLENIGTISNTQGLPHLKNQLLGDILDGGQGTSMMNKKVFIVLDDVDHLDQLECLLGNGGWLGEGSIVIITTRNKHLLTVQGVDDMYEVPKLNFEEAKELFNLYAFQQNVSKLEFINLSHPMIYYCQGLPLALKVLGSLLFNKTILEWESELHKLEREPEMEIHNVLKRSYDGLGCTEKNILLDVACFFGDEDKDFVSRILDGCNFHAEIGLKNLNDMCLITIPYNKIRMHDLIQQMAWEIVREDYPHKLNKWSRLWDPRDIDSALTTYKGIHGVETFSLDLCKFKRVRFNPNVLAMMTSLRLLKVRSGFFYGEGMEDKDYDVIIENASKMNLGLDFEFSSYELRYLRWEGYPLEFLPSNFDGENLIELHLKCSNIKQLWQGNKYLERLKVIDMSHSKKLIQMPEFSSMSNLEKLILNGCVSLIEIHPSIGVLKKLTTLNLRWCDKLKGLPSSIINLEALVVLNLYGCSSFDKFPKIQGNMRSLRYLDLSMTAIRELPNGTDLESVEILDLRFCSEFEKFPENEANMKSLKQLYLNNTAIKELPTGIDNWESLPILDLSGCSKFEIFPKKVGNMKSLKELRLNNTVVMDLPDSIGDLECLELLDLSYCSKLEKFPEKVRYMKRLKVLCLNNTAIKNLPDSIRDLEYLEVLNLSGCSKLEKFPEMVGNMKRLEELFLKNTAVKDLPDSIGDLGYLEILDLSDCSKFEKFPKKVGNMKSLKELRLNNTVVKDLPDSIGDLENLAILVLSDCSKFVKFPEKVGNMKRLKVLLLNNTAVKDLPDSIGDLECLVVLDLSDCSKFEKFPEKVGNMKRLRKLCLKNTAVKDLPDSIGDLEYLQVLDLSDCSKFEKFPEKVGNMKRLEVLLLNNTTVKDLPDSIGDLEYLVVLDLSNCSKFEKFPKNVENMKRLKVLLNNTVVKDLPDSIGDLEYLVDLDLLDRSKFEKFPKKVGYGKSLKHFRLKHPWLLGKYSVEGLTKVGDNSGAVIHEESNGNQWRSSDDSEADAVEEEPRYESFWEKSCCWIFLRTLVTMVNST